MTRFMPSFYCVACGAWVRDAERAIVVASPGYHLVVPSVLIYEFSKAVSMNLCALCCMLSWFENKARLRMCKCPKCWKGEKSKP